MQTSVEITAAHYVMPRLMFLHILLINCHHVVCGPDEDVWYSVAIRDINSLLVFVLHIGPRP